MITINYITSDCWWDTDKTILPLLSKKYRLNVFSFDSNETNLKYKNKENYGFNLFFVYQQRYSIIHLFALGEALRFFCRIRKEAKKKDSLNFVIPMGNLYLTFLFIFLLPRKRTVFSFHNYIEHTENKASLFRRLYMFQKKEILSKFSFFHFYSYSQMDAFNKDYPNKLSFYSKMPLKDFGHRELKRFSKKRTFLFFGHIRDYKRLDLFIQAANDVDAFFVVAGECPEIKWKEYEEIINDRNKFSINVGFVENSSIPYYFENVDFLVLPYEDATQSGPALIALNYGLPIIASDINTFKSIINDSKNGFLFEKGNAESLRNVMKKACKVTDIELGEMKSNQSRYKEKYEKECSPVSTMDSIVSAIFKR